MSKEQEKKENFIKRYRKKLKWTGIFVLCALAVIGLDQWSKQLAIARLTDRDAYPLINGVLEFDLYSNTGIAWSMLDGQKVFILFTGLIFLILIAFVICKLPETSKFRILYLLGGILAGGGA